GRITSEKTLIEKINQTVYEPLTEVYGSISAEHGIGTDKKPYLHLSRTSAEIALMKTLKATLDPLNILNRGKVMPE
ncbi:MAG: FAD-linked oxidase C-terminal domain-containing protein, partial [Bacteroidota bacterium]